MPAGLQVWDANGLLIVDTSTLLPRAVNIGAVSENGSVNIPMLTSSTVVPVPVVDTSYGFPPDVTIDNAGTVTWTKKNGREFNSRLSVMLL